MGNAQTVNKLDQSNEKKLVIFSEPLAGRTGVFNRLLGRNFATTYYNNCGFDYREKIYYVNGKKINYKIWSYGSNIEFSEQILNEADAILIVFDLGNSIATKNVPDLISNLSKYNNKIILVANKIDLPGSNNNKAQLGNLTQLYRCFWVSAKIGTGINILLNYLHKNINASIQAEPSETKQIY